jgi:hypothetical protein
MDKSYRESRVLLGIVGLVCSGPALLLSVVIHGQTFVTPLQINPLASLDPVDRGRLMWIPSFGILCLLLALGLWMLASSHHRQKAVFRGLLHNPPLWTGMVALALILYGLASFVSFVNELPAGESPWPAPGGARALELELLRLRAGTGGWIVLYWILLLCAYQMLRTREHGTLPPVLNPSDWGTTWTSKVGRMDTAIQAARPIHDWTKLIKK